MKRALFLDRDGVVNVDVGYAHAPEQITFVSGIFDLCRSARASGHALVIVTNQAGIGRGYYTEAQFHHLMRWMSRRFVEEGAPLHAYYYCPHHAEHGLGDYRRACDCRKPAPGMLLAAAREHGFSLPDSCMIGDKQTDMEAAAAAGVRRMFLVREEMPAPYAGLASEWFK